MAAPDRHNGRVQPQDPAIVMTAAATTRPLLEIGWIDVTALSVLAVLFVLGLFKGFVWQLSRVLILVAAYFGALHYGGTVGGALLDWTHAGSEAPTHEQAEMAGYIACVLVFLGVLVTLSLLTLLVQSLIKKAGLGFYDRLFGGLAGMVSGALVVVVMLTGIRMFFAPDSPVAAAADDSHSLRFTQQVVRAFGQTAPPGLRGLFDAEAAAEAGSRGGSKRVHALEAAGDGPGSPSEAALLPKGAEVTTDR